jgi:hypothetical protein
MTQQQIISIRDGALPHNAVPYGTPELKNESWIVGFQPANDYMALEVTFRDREIHNEADLHRATEELARAIRNALMLSR